ncbi:MAG TPA: hypothetical protein V6C89_20990 [Drouetiella sp.]|jgi:hypothetical protein
MPVIAMKNHFALALLFLFLGLTSNTQAISRESATASSSDPGEIRRANGVKRGVATIVSIQSGIFQFGSADPRHFVVTSDVPLSETVTQFGSDSSHKKQTNPQLYGYVIQTRKHSGTIEVSERQRRRTDIISVPIDSSGCGCRSWSAQVKKNLGTKVIQVNVDGIEKTLTWNFVKSATAKQ